jgi:hypothetical protein
LTLYCASSTMLRRKRNEGWCRLLEVPAPQAANPFRNFK